MVLDYGDAPDCFGQESPWASIALNCSVDKALHVIMPVAAGELDDPVYTVPLRAIVQEAVESVCSADGVDAGRGVELRALLEMIEGCAADIRKALDVF